MFNLTPTVRNLLLANLGFYLLQVNLRLDPSITQLGSLHPIGSSYFHYWQFFTYMFLHDPSGWGHLFFNMLTLLFFGPLLEQHWGGQRFMVFYLLCGIGAGMIYEGWRGYEIHHMEQIATEFHRMPSGADFANFFRTYYPDAHGYERLALALNQYPTNTEYLKAATESIDAAVAAAQDSPGGMLGASGAIFGLMVAMAYLFPNTEIYQLPIPFPIKAKYLVLYSFAIELYAGIHRVPGDNTAHFAHIGGAVIGLIILKFWEGGRTRFY